MAFQKLGKKFCLSEEENHSSSQESLPLSQGTYEQLRLSQGTSDFLSDVMQLDENPTIKSEPDAPDCRCMMNNADSYGFSVSFCQEAEKLTKSANWTYSELMKTMYSKMDSPCPFRLSVSSPIPQGCFIRAAIHFKEEKLANEAPQRCPIHQSWEDPSNIGVDYIQHLLRSDLAVAKYETDFYTRKPSVLVPFQGASQLLIYKVMCLSSCSGGINRRPVLIYFTLEHQGQVLGQCSVEIRVCSCPGRDKIRDEKRLNKASGIVDDNTQGVRPATELKRANSSKTSEEPTIKRGKVLKDTTNGQPGYDIHVTSKRLYKVILAVVSSLSRLDAE